MINPSNGRFPATLPGVTARGRQAGTADDQRFVLIVLGVIDLIVMMPATPMAPAVLAMAIPSANAVALCGAAIEEIRGMRAIGTVYTK